MAIETLARYVFGDTAAVYQHDPADGHVGLLLVPAAMIEQMVPHRASLRGQPEIDKLPGGPELPAWRVDSLVQLKLVGDAYGGGFAQGRTLRNGASTLGLRFQGQQVVEDGDATTVVTTLAGPRGYTGEHRLTWRRGDGALEAQTIFHNEGAEPLTLEMLSSFSLGGITPFDAADAVNRLVVHRFRSAWSAEGRLESIPVEQLHLERSWAGHGVVSERFGQAGSMPVHGFFPFVAVEDQGAGVAWGAGLAWAGSWQMEVYRHDDCLCLSGGLADRELGHWLKTVAPGETFVSPTATVAVAQGSEHDAALEGVCRRLTAMQQRTADGGPAVEADLPIIANEYCTTWGKPSHDSLLALAQGLKGSPVRYLVIDAGWYAPENGSWSSAHGDWLPNRGLFPDGLDATAAAIRREGLIPGLWFEMETCGPDSTAFTLTDHLLKRDGIPIMAGARRFWDLRDPWVHDYLAERVIGLLRRCGFGYLKVDYNEPIGIGCDGAESLGEGLRQQIEGVYRFFRTLRAELPDLVIENCSSGGHRLEPSMMALTAMASFSDAHELAEIPVIAANLHRLILPRQSQIWAVLHKNDSHQRLVYSLAATFLGRMCLSGELPDLDEAQWALVHHAEDLYGQVAPIIKRGASYRYGPALGSYRHPQGWQGMLRLAEDGTQALAVVHTFGEPVPERIDLPLPGDHGWHVAGMLADGEARPTIAGSSEAGRLVCPPLAPFSGLVVYLDSH